MDTFLFSRPLLAFSELLHVVTETCVTEVLQEVAEELPQSFGGYSPVFITLVCDSTPKCFSNPTLPVLFPGYRSLGMRVHFSPDVRFGEVSSADLLVS